MFDINMVTPRSRDHQVAKEWGARPVWKWSRSNPAMGSYLRITTTLQPRPGVPIRALKDGQKGAAGGGQSKAAFGIVEQGWGMRTEVGGHYYG